MRLFLASVSLLASSAVAFVPPSSSSSAAEIKLNGLPNWLVDAGSSNLVTAASQAVSPKSLNDFNGFKDTLSAISLPETASTGSLADAFEGIFSLMQKSEGSLSEISSLLQDNEALIQLAATPWHLEAISAFGFGSLLLWFVTTPESFDEAPYESGTSTYSPEKAAEFYNNRPLVVFKRILKLAFLTGKFNAGLLFDWIILGKLLKDEEYTALRENEPRRAKLALKLCEKLGPTFIKLGQALSIRTDLVPEAYALELRQLVRNTSLVLPTELKIWRHTHFLCFRMFSSKMPFLHLTAT